MTARAELVAALTALDDALLAGRFADVDAVLRDFAYEHAEIDLIVTVLMTCKPARAQLPNRGPALERLRARLQAEEPERLDAIMRHL